MILYNTKQQEVTDAVFYKSSSDRYFSIAILSSLHRRFSSEVFPQRIKYLDHQKYTHNLNIQIYKFRYFVTLKKEVLIQLKVNKFVYIRLICKGCFKSTHYSGL